MAVSDGFAGVSFDGVDILKGGTVYVRFLNQNPFRIVNSFGPERHVFECKLWPL